MIDKSLGMIKEKKTARLEVLMTPNEKQELDELAFKLGLPSSQLVRMLIKRAIKEGGL